MTPDKEDLNFETNDPDKKLDEIENDINKCGDIYIYFKKEENAECNSIKIEKNKENQVFPTNEIKKDYFTKYVDKTKFQSYNHKYNKGNEHNDTQDSNIVTEE